MKSHDEISHLTQIEPETRYNAEQTAALLGVAKSTLSNWRVRGVGPAFIRYFKHSPSWYFGRDITAFIESKRVQTTMTN